MKEPVLNRGLLLWSLTQFISCLALCSSAIAFETNVTCEIRRDGTLLDRVSFGSESSVSNNQNTTTFTHSNLLSPLCYVKYSGASHVLSEMNCEPEGIQGHQYDFAEKGFTRRLQIMIAPHPSVKVERKGHGTYSRRDLVVQGDPRSFDMVLFNEIPEPNSVLEYLKWRIGAKYQTMPGRLKNLELEGYYSVPLAPVGEPLSLANIQISHEIVSKDGHLNIRCSN